MTIRPNWLKIRAQLWERCSGRCEVTGIPLGDNWAVHHRRKKGMGGTSLPDVHALYNLMAVTHAAHNLGTMSIHLNPEWSKRLGYLIPAWDDPQLRPLVLLGRRNVWLTADGHYTSEPPACA
ncbi:MAG TPA: hypothetical protein VGH72_33990 [Pseudonocardia sp.]|jgi:hypothetical protein